jgi:hypothetical protein
LFMGLRKLGEKEAVKLVTSILKEAGKPLTTREIEEQTRKRMAACPDTTPVFLNKLRLRGIIEGQLSVERRGWIWWIRKEG